MIASQYWQVRYNKTELQVGKNERHILNNHAIPISTIEIILCGVIDTICIIWYLLVLLNFELSLKNLLPLNLCKGITFEDTAERHQPNM